MPRPQPQDGKSIIASWSPGLRVQGASMIFAGIFVDTEIDPRLDEAAASVDWMRGKIRHGDGEVREHWLIPSPTSLFVMIEGVPYKSVSALADHPADSVQALIGCRWRRELGERSTLMIHVVFGDLLDADYTTPIPFVVRSNNTDDLLAALLIHNDVLDRTEKATGATFDFWQLALPILAGEEVVRYASADPSASASVSPIRSAHPDQLTGRYIKGIQAPLGLHQLYREQHDTLQRAAVLFSEREERSPAFRARSRAS